MDEKNPRDRVILNLGLITKIDGILHGKITEDRNS